MTAESLLSYDVIFRFRLPYSLKFEILYLLTDLAEIWPMGRILGDDSESEMIKGLRKATDTRHSLTTGLLWQKFNSQKN